MYFPEYIFYKAHFKVSLTIRILVKITNKASTFSKCHYYSKSLLYQRVVALSNQAHFFKFFKYQAAPYICLPCSFYFFFIVIYFVINTYFMSFALNVVVPIIREFFLYFLRL